MTSRPASPEIKISTSALLMQLAQAEGEERISVGEIVSRLGDRAPGLLLLMLALPPLELLLKTVAPEVVLEIVALAAVDV